jgi:hypothetical protein
MAVTPAPTVPTLPAFPAVSNRTTYNQEAYDCLNTLASTVAPGITAAGTAAQANAQAAEDAATTATAQATAAVAAVGAVLWVSGTNYSAGAAVYSPTTLASYRTATAGISNTDPATDAARWTRLGSPGVPDFILHAQGII